MVTAPLSSKKKIGGGADITFAHDDLIEVQRASFKRFLDEGIANLLNQTFPIEDTAKPARFRMLYGDLENADGPGYELREPRYTERQCRDQGLTYAAPLWVRLRLIINPSGGKEGGEEEEQWVFFGDIPKMTVRGTFIVHGTERVVVSQIIRSSGVYFSYERDLYTREAYCNIKLIPYYGAWIEVETAPSRVISIKIDRKRKMPITTFLKALGMTKNDIKAAFKDVKTSYGEQDYIEATLGRDPAQDRLDALKEMYKRLRPSEPTISDEKKAISFVEDLFYNPRKYDLGAIGKYKLDKKLGRNPNKDEYVGLVNQTIKLEDFVGLFKEMIRSMKMINSGKDRDVRIDRLPEDDVDHLGNRRMRTVGELLQNQLRVGMLRMEQSIIERMSVMQRDPGRRVRLSPVAFVNNRPIATAVRKFFAGSQLSQFADQTNPLAELTHKRRVSAMGTGGLTRERASFDVRDVHYSHYGRLCPIETPEGPNIGLLNSLATYAKVDPFGLIQTPYFRVRHNMRSDSADLKGRTLYEDVHDDDGKLIAEDGTRIKSDVLQKLAAMKPRKIQVKPYISPKKTGDFVYLSADEELKSGKGKNALAKFVQANTAIDARGQLVVPKDKVEVRQGDTYFVDDVRNVDYIDYSAMQTISVTTALIPFLEHDDANRALMGSNMQRQAVPLIKPQAPVIGTGMESSVAGNSGQVEFSEAEGVITYVSGEQIDVTDDKGKVYTYKLRKFIRSNQGTCINQRPIVRLGQRVTTDQVIADSYSSDGGELSLGQNLLVGFMSWGGYNFEDAIIVSEDLIRNDAFTSVHIEKHELEARETKLGLEEMTRDIPNVGEDRLRNLDEDGVVRIGAWVEPGDVLVGKISPRSETELTAEEKLLRAIFGDKARDVKDSSKRLPHGQRGKVIHKVVLTRENGDKLQAGVLKAVHVWVARMRKLGVGDKMAGRHGNKGVVAKILPREDMPFLKDGRRLDIILNPIGVPSRMNLGQLLEAYIGWSASALNMQVRTPAFQSLSQDAMQDYTAQVWLLEQSDALDRANFEGGEVDYDKLDSWLAERGYKRDELWDKSTLGSGKAREACLKIWFRERVGENCDGMSLEEMQSRAREIEQTRSIPSPISGKQELYDGRTGQPFLQPVNVGVVYMMKLYHLADDKIHARSIGPYSLVTQQPLGGKAQFGGQRFGEMEVWALQAYSSAYTLQELLTIKSDDVRGRNEAYEAICHGDLVNSDGTPESFQVLIKEMQSLGLSTELLSQPDIQTDEGMGAIEGMDLGDDDQFDLEKELLDTGKLPGIEGLGPEEDW